MNDPALSISVAEYSNMLAEQAAINEARGRKVKGDGCDHPLPQDTLLMGEHCWAEAFTKRDAKVGATLRIRLPADYTATDGPCLPGTVPANLTRFDPSTSTRVPVTQEWVDEAVAEIVRLNIELSAMPASDPGVTLPEVDRIWEAVRAASAV